MWSTPPAASIVRGPQATRLRHLRQDRLRRGDSSRYRLAPAWTGSWASVPSAAPGRWPTAGCKTGAGDLQVEDRPARSASTPGTVLAIAENVAGDAEHHDRLRQAPASAPVGGHAVLKNGNGDTWIGEAGGELRVRAANGHIAAEHAAASVTREHRQR